MPRMRCIDNQSYLNSLTIGRIYDIEFTRTDFCRVVNNNGVRINCFKRRFESIEEETPVLTPTPTTIEYYTNSNQLSIGMKVRVRSNLEHIFNEATNDPGYCLPMDDLIGQEVTIRSNNTHFVRIEEDAYGYNWCVEAFEPITVAGMTNVEEVNSVPVSEFAVGDIVRIKETARYYAGSLSFIKEINAATVKLSISSTTTFYIREIEKITEEDLNIPVEPLIVVPEYTQITETEEIKKGMRIKLPTRKTMGHSLEQSITILEVLTNNCDYLTVKNIYSSGVINVRYNFSSNNYNRTDIEILDTNFVQGAIENGHRIKDKSGRTHTYEAHSTGNTNQTLITNNDTYIDYIDSTGWFIRVWKELVTKPRGTVQYTEYMAMTSEDYAIYKTQTEERIAYVKALVENTKINKRNERRTNNITEYANLKREVEAFLVKERERLEAKRRKEVNVFGIWKHHDKSWI